MICFLAVLIFDLGDFEESVRFLLLACWRAFMAFLPWAGRELMADIDVFTIFKPCLSYLAQEKLLCCHSSPLFFTEIRTVWHLSMLLLLLLMLVSMSMSVLLLTQHNACCIYSQTEVHHGVSSFRLSAQPVLPPSSQIYDSTSPHYWGKITRQKKCSDVIVNCRVKPFRISDWSLEPQVDFVVADISFFHSIITNAHLNVMAWQRGLGKLPQKWPLARLATRVWRAKIRERLGWPKQNLDWPKNKTGWPKLNLGWPKN